MILTKKDYDELGGEKFCKTIWKFYVNQVNNDPKPRKPSEKFAFCATKQSNAIEEFKETGQCDLTKH